MQAETPTFVWKIDPLPDFLADHTYAAQSPTERLKEVASRWVQWLASFWGWKERATFALRFRAENGRIDIFLVARIKGQFHADSEQLRNDVCVLLRSARIPSIGAGNDPRVIDEFKHTQLNKMALVELRQQVRHGLWQLPKSSRENEGLLRELGDLSSPDAESPRVVYPWWGPGGPFLLPMEAMLSQSVPVTLMAYLEPTVLQPYEWSWLACMAREAMALSDQQVQQVTTGGTRRRVDPSATLAGRLYIANLRRLTSMPFLVTVHCGAADARFDVARALASTIQTVAYEPPYERPDQEDARLPAGAASNCFDGPNAAEEFNSAANQYKEVWFSHSRSDSLSRLSLLVDARGAATMFRLPVSIRGGVPGVQVKQMPPDFIPGPREDLPPADGRRYIELGMFRGGGKAYIPLNDLTKHVLVCGFTGSGKTVTVLQILHQLVENGVPFLVLESAKQEYRGLLGVDLLGSLVRVYTLGNETCVPFRLNPFELLPGVRVEAHLGKLQNCFEAAIPPVGPSSSVISESLLRSYETLGWSLTDVCPEEPKRRFPTLSDFIREVENVLSNRGYGAEMYGNLRAAIVGRFTPLLIGSKGLMFDTQRSSPRPVELFSYPTVLEMNDLQIEDKALVVMFILTLLREYREADKSRPGELKHVTVVEEAHNVLEDVASQGGGEGATSADTRYRAVQSFCSLLTEIRALGEGLIIADQSPEKLARDAIRNTNLQIAHQLRDGRDRDAIANAMIMENEQRDYLGKLMPGMAAVFRTGLEKATFISVTPYYPLITDKSGQYRGKGFLRDLEDATLLQLMKSRVPSIDKVRNIQLPLDACRLCPAACRHRDWVYPLVESDEGKQLSDQWAEAYRAWAGKSNTAFWKASVSIASEMTRKTGTEHPDIGMLWCSFAHLWSKHFGPNPINVNRLDADHFAIFQEIFRNNKI